MNVHGMASGLVSNVNPQTDISIQKSTGYTVQADGTQQPTYGPSQTVKGQVQPLSSNDLSKVEGLNIQPLTYKVYLPGDYEGVVRIDGKGGDLLIWGGRTYLVTTVLERWPDWVCVGVTMQAD